MGGGSVIGVCMAGWVHSGVLAGETRRYHRLAATLGVGVPLCGLLVLFPAAVGATIAAPKLPPNAHLASLFPGSVLTGMRALVAVGAGEDGLRFSI